MFFRNRKGFIPASELLEIKVTSKNILAFSSKQELVLVGEHLAQEELRWMEILILKALVKE